MELKDLFTTVAQVSFAIAGLVFIGLTLDDETRKFWFSEANAVYVNTNLLLIILPGLVSLGGLIPQVPFLLIPSWAWMNLLIGGLYFSVTIIYNLKTKRMPKYRPIFDTEKRFGTVTSDLLVHVFMLWFVSGTAISLHMNDARCIQFSINLLNLSTSQQLISNLSCIQLVDSVFGVFLVFLVILGTGPVFRFVRSYSETSRIHVNEIKTPHLEAGEHQFQVKDETAALSSPEKDTNTPVLVLWGIALVGFFMGAVVSNILEKADRK